MEGSTVSWFGAYGPVIQASLLLLSFIAATAAIVANMSIARRRATIDLLMMEISNLDWVEARREFVALKSDKQGG